MNKGSMIFKIMCLAVCLVFCLSSLPAFAEEAAETDESTTATVPAEDETNVETTEGNETAEDEEAEEIEVLDLYAATLRDNGIYVTPGENNIAAFTYDGLRYKVEAGAQNAIDLNGFENSPDFDSSAIEDDVPNRLQATGSVVVEAAHSGYFGLAVSAGKVVYRSEVTSGNIYVFSEWIKVPKNGIISDNGRAFVLKGNSGTNYIVGYNEIGRDIESTGNWQQVIFTFKAPENGLFEMSFEYRGREPMYMDDMELYRASVFNNPLTITSVKSTDSAGNSFDSDGFSAAGDITHTTTFYNNDEDDVYYTALLILYKNNIMVDYVVQEGNIALVLDEAVNTLTVNIPEGEDLSQYMYTVYFINDSDPTIYYGDVTENNPYMASGR